MASVEIVQRMFAAFAARNFDAFRALEAPDMVWAQSEGFPDGGRYVGADAVIENVFGAFARDWRDWRFDVEEMHDIGDAVLVIGAYSGCHRGTGKAFRAGSAHVYDVAAGKITRFRQFADTQLIAGATR